MAKQTRNLVAGALVVATVFGAVGPARAEDRPVVSVRLQFRTTPSSTVLDRAISSVTRIYEAAGIDLTWEGAPDSETMPVNHRILVVLTTSPLTLPRAANRAVMGFAIEAERGCGTVAYIFYERVLAFARQHSQNPAVVLGLVIAHEIGHLLLPPSSHTSKGIMKGFSDAQDLYLAQRGKMTFSPEQAATMRAQLFAITSTTDRR